MVHFDDGLCITGKSVIESVCDFGLTPQHDRRRTAQIRTRASNRTFLLRGAYEADQDYPAHRRAYPELQTYRCEQCHNVETIEVK